jgi:HEAT repeat protein
MYANKPPFWVTMLSFFLLVFGRSGFAQVPKDLSWQVLSNGVRDKNAATRAIAVRSLGLVRGDKAAEKQALESLKDSTEEVRVSAATSLGEMNAKDSIPSLKEALKDTSVRVILAAANSLRSLGDPSAYLVYYAVLTGERKSGEGLLAEQKKALSDPKKMAQLGFEQGIGFVPFASLGLGAIKAFTPGDDSPVRAAAALALATDPDPKSGEALLRAVQDKSWIVRAAALESIARRNDPALIPEIIDALNDARPEVKYTAAAAIYHLSILTAPKVHRGF